MREQRHRPARALQHTPTCPCGSSWKLLDRSRCAQSRAPQPIGRQRPRDAAEPLPEFTDPPPYPFEAAKCYAGESDDDPESQGASREAG